MTTGYIFVTAFCFELKVGLDLDIDCLLVCLLVLVTLNHNIACDFGS